MPPTILATLGVPVAAAQDSNSLAENATQAVWSTIVSIWQDFFRHLPLLIAALIVLVLTWIVAALFRKFASRLLHRFRLRGSQRTLISRLVDIVIWVTGLLIASMVVFPGLTPSNALAGLGIGSIAVGFAFKDIFENFFAGLLILWRFPFETGDFIHCQDVEGKVIEVTIRNTCIRRVSGELVVVPNSTIFKNSVDVLTYERLRRAMVIAGVAYGENVDQARDVIRKAVEGCETVSNDRPVQIFACEFAGSSINFEVAWWTRPEPLDMRKSRDEVVAAVKAALDEAGIEIPFPYRTLVFKDAIHVDRPKQ